MRATWFRLHREYKRLVFFAFVLLIFGSFTHAQTVTGTVTDSQKAPIAGASVRLKDRDKMISTTTTDERGTFSLASNNTPKLDLTIEAAGFAELKLHLPNGLEHELSRGRIRFFKIFVQKVI